MDKYKKYLGVIIFLTAITALVFVAVSILLPKYNNLNELKAQASEITETLNEKRTAKANIQAKIKRRIVPKKLRKIESIKYNTYCLT